MPPAIGLHRPVSHLPLHNHAALPHHVRMHARLRLDAIIFGGGVCGLWLLDELRRAGYAACLVECRALGAGQTIASQGIIHGGLKYTLDGVLNPAAETIREMPQVWRECLRGERAPDLRRTRLLTDHCHLWRTGGLSSRMGMLGAKLALRVRPVPLAKDQWPAVLRGTAGEVLRLDEQVIDPASLLADLAAQNQSALFHVTDQQPPQFELDAAGAVRAVTLTSSSDRATLTLEPAMVILAAGSGNAQLRTACGLEQDIMQRRPLHMLMVRGPLPALYGHCTDGARTRVTITTNHDSAGRTIWLVGGQLAEHGVQLSPADLIDYGRRELRETVGELPFPELDWATYRIERAEPITAENRRPSDAFAKREGNIITAWPTKLALAPRAAECVRNLIPPPLVGETTFERDKLAWPSPAIAAPPWEEATWFPAS